MHDDVLTAKSKYVLLTNRIIKIRSSWKEQEETHKYQLLKCFTAVEEICILYENLSICSIKKYLWRILDLKFVKSVRSLRLSEDINIEKGSRIPTKLSFAYLFLAERKLFGNILFPQSTISSPRLLIPWQV
jgi:hypothetical protein